MKIILSSKPDSKSPGLIKVFRHYVSLYPEEDSTLFDDIHLLAKAQKKEQKMRDRCELTFTDPKKGKKSRYEYLRSLPCLQAQMIEANKKRRIKNRLSLRQIIEASLKYKILGELNEPVNVFQEPKASGDGLRTIQDFGPVARGAQCMVAVLLQMAYTPAPFQYNRLGVREAITEAVRLITEEGYTHVTELDITSHYPSFLIEELVKALQLPKSAILQIVAASSAQWETDNHPTPLGYYNHFFHTPPLGIPQGSAASTIVAEWSVSKLKMIKVKDTVLINYADNFFLFGKCKNSVAFALEALRYGIAKLPGGVFNSHPDKSQPDIVQSVTTPFRMLGCHIVKMKDGVDVSPTETNLQKLNGRMAIKLQEIQATLLQANKLSDSKLRFEGVQEFLRLQSYVNSWLEAFSMCTDIEVFRSDLHYQLDELAYIFGIEKGELEKAKDSSTECHYYPSSAIAA